ncbi:MAG: NusG domain II-containing protein [Firmicutes bacterium]|nr:NusG domain II-containing protein [Bacillota bacterium]
MIRKKDWLIICLALLMSAAAYGAMVWARGGQALSGMVEIRVNGELYAAVPLDEERDVVIEQESGEKNIISINDGGVRMAYASCKNQLCLHQGEVTASNWAARALGRSIVCLPNRVLVELALSDSGRRIVDENLPDV